jgi:uncharacterized repeat protein (TIGR01451 family)
MKKEKHMKQRLGQYLPGQRSLFAALALGALAAFGSPETASANSTANTTILNTVRVDYKDASGTNSFAANASTIVTVNLVKSALNPSGAPTGAGVPGLTCLPALDTASGTAISALYALTASANGQDTYTLTMGAPTPHNVVNAAVTYNILKFDGTLDGQPQPVGGVATRVLGSAIPTAVLSANSLEFPGGALAGFSVNDIVIVPTFGGVNRAFLVTAVSAGTAPVFSHTGNTAYTDATGALTTPEVKGSLTLGAYANQSITLNGVATGFGGGGTAPAFTTPATAAILGVPVSEMALVQVNVSAQTIQTTPQLDGTVDYVLTTTASGGTNPATIGCLAVGTFKAPTLSIKKEARNFSTSGAFGATANGNPGELLEYRVTVTNTGGQAAQVVVADAVPVYTTLTAFSGSYGGGAPTNTIADVFARISNGSTFVDVTRSTVDSETQPAAPLAKIGYGRTGATTAAGSALTFYLGDSSTNAAGGKLPACSNTTFATQAACTGGGATWITSYTILYQVKID